MSSYGGQIIAIVSSQVVVLIKAHQQGSVFHNLAAQSILATLIY